MTRRRPLLLRNKTLLLKSKTPLLIKFKLLKRSRALMLLKNINRALLLGEKTL